MVDPVVRSALRHKFDVVSLAAMRRGAGLAGLELPELGRFVAQDDLVVICTTPGQYLVMSDVDGLFERLQAMMEDSFTLIELSSSRAATVVSGTAAREALGTLLPIDLHPRAMRRGDAAATIAAHLPVLVRQIDDRPSYELICARSYEASLLRALELAGIRQA